LKVNDDGLNMIMVMIESCSDIVFVMIYDGLVLKKGGGGKQRTVAVVFSFPSFLFFGLGVHVVSYLCLRSFECLCVLFCVKMSVIYR
jgi:hypothetical protein